VTTKRELTEADDRGWARFIRTIESLNDEQLVEVGYYLEEGWSVKDLTAHIGFWMTEAANRLEQMRFGTYDPAAVDAETLNKEFYEANRDVPLPIIRAECFSAHTRMLQELDALPELGSEAEEWFTESADRHYSEHQPRLDEWAAELRSRAGS
jgi:DinB superfamily